MTKETQDARKAKALVAITYMLDYIKQNQSAKDLERCWKAIEVLYDGPMRPELCRDYPA